jgi:hypothetical protein
MNKIFYYKKFAKYKIELHDFDKAFKYLNKMVILAWDTKQLDYELKAFDLFGLTYYYIGDIKMADFFHKKMASGMAE